MARLGDVKRDGLKAKPGDVFGVGALAAADDNGAPPGSVKAAFCRPPREQPVRLRPGPGHLHLSRRARAVEALEPRGRIAGRQRSGSEPVLPFVRATASVPQDRGYHHVRFGAAGHQRQDAGMVLARRRAG